MTGKLSIASSGFVKQVEESGEKAWRISQVAEGGSSADLTHAPLAVPESGDPFSHYL